MPDLDFHEVIFTTRAIRRLRPDPVPDADLRYMVEAATRAPTAANAQSWAFVVVTDPEQRRALGEIYRELGRAVIPRALEGGQLPSEQARAYRNALALVEHLGEAPAVIVVAVRGAPPHHAAEAAAYYGSIFPAIQNLMLAARSRGLGTTLTTLHVLRDDDVRAILGIPDPFHTVAMIPVGYPRGRFGSPRRGPASQVTHWNRWGGSYPD